MLLSILIAIALGYHDSFCPILHTFKNHHLVPQDTVLIYGHVYLLKR